jgi:hypothetical protein
MLHIDAPRPSGTSPPTVPERCRASNHLEQIGQTDNPSRWRAGHAPVKHRDVWCVAEETAHRSLSIHEYSGRRGLRCFHQDSWDRVPTPPMAGAIAARGKPRARVVQESRTGNPCGGDVSGCGCECASSTGARSHRRPVCNPNCNPDGCNPIASRCQNVGGPEAKPQVVAGTCRHAPIVAEW